MFHRRLIGLIKKVYPRLGLEDDDVILASFPKSGNTWFRFIWLNIVSLLELDGREIDFHIINGSLNAEYDSHSYGSIKYDSLPRIVKTHMTCKDRFLANSNIYLMRNPGDVMISFFEYQQAQKENKNCFDDISPFIRSPQFGIEYWCKHVSGWYGKADFIIKYEGLKKDPFNKIVKILDRLNLYKEIDDSIIKEAIKRSSFEEMRKIEEKKGRPNMAKNFDEGFKFTRKGRLGEWKKRLNHSDIELINKTLKKYDLEHLYTL